MGHRGEARRFHEELRGDRMIGAKVNVVSGWGAEFAKHVNEQTKTALEEASRLGAQVASQASEPRHRTGKMAKMELLEVRGTPSGWTGGFRSEAFYAGFQSRGTRGNRRGKVSAATLRRRASASGQARGGGLGGGITPLGFLEKGRTAARKDLIDRLNRL